VKGDAVFLETPAGRKTLRAAIAGNPNAGKTSLFNAMTGRHLKVANYPGVTVERREGRVRRDGRELTFVDLPGTYSLSAQSADEIVAREYLVEETPDVVVDVVDASNLERNLYLAVQFLEMELPLVIALNMVDVAAKRGSTIDAKKMAALLNVPVIPTVGHRGYGAADVIDACWQMGAGVDPPAGCTVTYGHEVDDEVDELADRVADDAGLSPRCTPRHVAVKLIERDPQVLTLVRRFAEDPVGIEQAAEQAIRAIEEHFGESAEVILAEARYGFVAGIVRRCVTRQRESRRTVTDQVDAFVCHRVFGPLFLAGVVYLLFVLVFRLADGWPWLFGRSPTQWMEWSFAALGSALAGLKPTAPMLHSLLVDGVVGGVGGIMCFVPLIFVLFACVAVLEDTGYLARVAFVLDRALKVFGLQGKSVLAMIVSGGLGGGGCAVPGVMATRVLQEEKDRLVTMLVAPLMNCGAKMPVYLLLIAAFFPALQAKMLFVLWVLSWVFALGAAWVIRRFVVKGPRTPFVMELPIYHVPTVRGVLRHTWQRTWMFIRKAGTLILATSIILWALMYFPHLDTADLDARVADARSAALAEGTARPEAIGVLTAERRAAQLRHSVAGRLGSALEPVSRWAGFDWRDNIALIGGFAAKEVVVGTLGVAYSMGNVNPDESESLSQRLREDPGWSPLQAFAMMIFVMIYAPCVTVQIVTRRESGGWKWPLFSLTYTTVLAFALAVAVYQVGSAAGIGV
jgi:ferrous iron transport protein B